MIFSLCLPESCSPSDFKIITNIIVKVAQLFVKGVNITLNDYMCETINTQPTIDKYDIYGM